MIEQNANITTYAYSSCGRHKELLIQENADCLRFYSGTLQSRA